MGWQEWTLIGLVAVLLFGARKLPELGKSLGEGIKEFKKASKGVLDEEDSSAKDTAETPESTKTTNQET